MKWLVITILFCSMISCIHDPISPIPDSPDEIQLKWNASYENDKIDDAILGLNWALSQVGGKNTRNSTNGFEINEQTITLNLNQIQFSEKGYLAMFSLHQSLKNSETYYKNGSIDVGRYITLLIGSSIHYYRFVNMPAHLSEVISKYKLQPQKGFLNNSAISPNHRTLAFSAPEHLNQLFLSSEIDSVTGRTIEFETMELGSNGQIIFGIFDADSHLVNSADPSISASGKPAKCMWCHESKINPLFRTQSDSLGFLTANQLRDSLVSFRQIHIESQSHLSSGIYYSKLEAHVQMELQYILFKQPSPMRLANEWNMTQNKVETLLANQPRFTYPEFPFLPAGYIRNNIESYAPFIGLLTSKSVREPSPYEVNYID